MCELSENQLLGDGCVGMDVKSKIKSIIDVYRQELHNIEKSKKIGCDIEEVYTPKLGKFNDKILTLRF